MPDRRPSTGTALWTAQEPVGELPVDERDPMTLFNPAASGGDGPVHDVLLIAGSRAEAVRLAPIAAAISWSASLVACW